MNYDLAILGGGPAGAAASVYAARKRLTTILVVEEFGGQSNVSPDIQNWIGTPSIPGTELAKNFKEHVEAYKGNVLQIAEGARVEALTKNKDGDFTVATTKDDYRAKAVLVATGARRRKLNIPGAEEFENKGVVYCASCDGPLFADMDVAVVGGGNAGFETAAQLLQYAKSVTLLQRSERYKADKITVDKVLENPKMTGILNAKINEIKGDNFVRSIIYTDTTTGKDKGLSVTGAFVEIGLIPNTDFVDGLLEMDEYKRIVIDPWTQTASVEGIWAAGDCSNVRYHQNNIAAGDAVKALENIYLWLHQRQ